MFQAELRDGVSIGPWRRPVNIAADAKGSIHDDATAQKLGLKGGTVAGSIHMEQYPPLLTTVLGSDWWNRGSLSLHFREVTTHGEPVRCFAGTPQRWPGFARAQVWMEGENGTRINEGTASVGGADHGSALRARLAEARPQGELRILANAHVGASVSDTPARITSAQLDAHLPVITEPLAVYANSGGGERVLSMNLTIDAFRVIEKSLIAAHGPRVGLYGAIEVQYLDGPVFADRDYVASGRILAFSDSPRTEIAWWEAELADAASGATVAKMLHMTRLMKDSSPLWAAN